MQLMRYSLLVALAFSRSIIAQPYFLDTSMDLSKIAYGAMIQFNTLVHNPDSQAYNLRLEHICGCTEFTKSNYALPPKSTIAIPIKYHSSGNKGHIQRGFYINYSGSESGRQKISFFAEIDTLNNYQKPIMDTGLCYTFARTTINCGNIPEGEIQTFIFEVNNCSQKPLIISNVQSSCGCVTPSWSKEPIKPGEVGTIKAHFNSNSRPGTFHKTLTVHFVGDTKYTVLSIEGNVIEVKD